MFRRAPELVPLAWVRREPPAVGTRRTPAELTRTPPPLDARPPPLLGGLEPPELDTRWPVVRTAPEGRLPLLETRPPPEEGGRLRPEGVVGPGFCHAER